MTQNAQITAYAVITYALNATPSTALYSTRVDAYKAAYAAVKAAGALTGVEYDDSSDTLITFTGDALNAEVEVHYAE
jgi:hypothetical protein